MPQPGELQIRRTGKGLPAKGLPRDGSVPASLSPRGRVAAWPVIADQLDAHESEQDIYAEAELLQDCKESDADRRNAEGPEPHVEQEDKKRHKGAGIKKKYSG